MSGITGPVLYDGHNTKFKYYLYQYEIDEYRKRYDAQPHDVRVRMFDWFVTCYFMNMRQTVLSRVRAVIRTRKSISRSEIREMIIKFEKDYAKSTKYEYLGIESPKELKVLSRILQITGYQQQISKFLMNDTN